MLRYYSKVTIALKRFIGSVLLCLDVNVSKAKKINKNMCGTVIKNKYVSKVLDEIE